MHRAAIFTELLRKRPNKSMILAMPAVLTHNFFGRDMLDECTTLDALTIEQRDAFLLGNQGPDPLFFLALHPTKRTWRTLGSTMHKQQTNELIIALTQALECLSEHEVGIGRAYAQGFLCHYALDSSVHPLVYSRQFALCDAGVEGLDRTSMHEVHAEIERELDEMVLFAKRQQTIRNYNPAENTLDASTQTLAIIEKIYAYLALAVYGQILDKGTFSAGVRSYRQALQALYSPFGIKRALLGSVERSVRDHSFYAAMAHRTEEVHSSWYANENHQTWEHPFTGSTQTASFWDLYQQALQQAKEGVGLLQSGNLGQQNVRGFTHDLNFSGEFCVATLVIES